MKNRAISNKIKCPDPVAKEKTMILIFPSKEYSFFEKRKANTINPATIAKGTEVKAIINKSVKAMLQMTKRPLSSVSFKRFIPNNNESGAVMTCKIINGRFR